MTEMQITIHVPIQVSADALGLWVEGMLNTPNTDGPWSAGSEKQERELDMLDNMVGNVGVTWNDHALLPAGVYRRAVELWGQQFQAQMLAEECGELVAAMSQYLRGRASTEKVVEETADVHIMLAQVPHILGGNPDELRTAISKEVAAKNWRLENLVYGEVKL